MASLPVPSQRFPAWTDGGNAAKVPALRPVPVQAAPHFSDLEWSIVAMAERDGLASLHKPSAFWSLIGAVFGLKSANRLANDRLEALRRIAVLAWRYHWNVPGSELEAFFAAGYSPDHFETMLGRMSAVRAEQRGRHAR